MPHHLLNLNGFSQLADCFRLCVNGISVQIQSKVVIKKLVFLENKKKEILSNLPYLFCLSNTSINHFFLFISGCLKDTLNTDMLLV